MEASSTLRYTRENYITGDFDFTDDLALLSHSHEQIQDKTDLLNLVSAHTGFNIILRRIFFLVFYLLYLHLMFYCSIVYCIGIIICIAAWTLNRTVIRSINGLNSRCLHVMTGEHYRETSTAPAYDLVLAVRRRRLRYLGNVLRMPADADNGAMRSYGTSDRS